MTRPSGAPPAEGLLVVLSGPSGVGKGTVLARAMSLRSAAAQRLRLSVSATTRPRRPDEEHGRDYAFCTPEQFLAKIEADEMLEWAEYLGHRYGTPADWVDRERAAGYDVVLEIEVQGAMQVKDHRPDAILIYMLPPSWRALRSRLQGRRSESEEVQEQRLAVARTEVERIRDYHYVVVNDRAERAARQLLAILEAEHARVERTDLRQWVSEQCDG